MTTLWYKHSIVCKCSSHASEARQPQGYCRELVQQLSAQVSFCSSASAIRTEWDLAESENLYTDFIKNVDHSQVLDSCECVCIGLVSKLCCIFLFKKCKPWLRKEPSSVCHQSHCWEIITAPSHSLMRLLPKPIKRSPEWGHKDTEWGSLMQLSEKCNITSL